MDYRKLSPSSANQNGPCANTVVLHIVPDGDWASGGVAYAAIRLAHEQARIGLDVYILELDPSRRISASWWCGNIKYIDFDGYHGAWKRFVSLRNFLLKNQPVVHFHGVWSPRFLPYFILAIFTKRYFIVSPHGSFELGALNQKFLKKYLARKIYLDRILSRTSYFWACSEKECVSLNREFPKVPVNIVPIGIDMPDMASSVNVEKQINKRKVILVISRLNPGKGVLNLVKAWYLIQDLNWRVIIAGPDENNYKKIIEREIANLNLTQFFSFPGYVNTEQRDALYRSADIFVLPSLSENFGIVVAEAMSYGVPVLTTNETPWAYVGLERGCLCVDTDPQALSKGLNILINLTETEKNKVGLAAQIFIRENFIWEKIVQISKNSLMNLLGKIKSSK